MATDQCQLAIPAALHWIHLIEVDPVDRIRATSSSVSLDKGIGNDGRAATSDVHLGWSGIS